MNFRPPRYPQGVPHCSATELRAQARPHQFPGEGRISFQERNRRQVPTKGLLSRGTKPDRHERAAVGRVWFKDRDERHAFANEPSGHGHERLLVGSRQDHSVGAFADVARTTLTRSMHDLGGLQPFGEVRAHDHVVRYGVRRFSRFAVVETACSGSYVDARAVSTRDRNMVAVCTHHVAEYMHIRALYTQRGLYRYVCQEKS